MKNILVTGGLGYIGGRLAKHFSEKKIRTLISTRKENYSFINNTKLKNIRVEKLDYNSKKKIIESINGFDTIIHLIGPDAHSNNHNAIKKKFLDIINNLTSAANMSGIKNIIYFSTIHVYGDNLKGVVTERTRPVPNHVFSKIHLEVEKTLLESASNFNVSIIRCANSFGIPFYQNEKCWSLVVNDFCRSAIRDKVIFIKSSGQQYKNFIGMEDVLIGTEYILEDEKINNSKSIYNLGGPRVFKLIDIAKKIINILKERYNINCNIKIEDNTNSVKSFVPFQYSIDKIKKLGFIPISTEKEIHRTLDYCIQKFKKEKTI